MINKMGILLRVIIVINEIVKGNQPKESLANHRWIGPVPEELSDLTWLGELLVARVHLIGHIVRLEEQKSIVLFRLEGSYSRPTSRYNSAY
jgi:hypothetical protein